MCIICVDLTKDKLTSMEARNNLKEMSSEIEEDHKLELLNLIWKKEDEEFHKEYDQALLEQDYDHPPSDGDDWLWGEDWMFNSGSD
jgi:hypothetical protein